MPSTTHSSSSWTQRSSGAGTAYGASSASTRASSAYDVATTRWATLLAALTNNREPSAVCSRDANPGVNPVPCDCEETTREPIRSSTSARTSAGRCSQASRRAVRPCGTGGATRADVG